MAGGLAGLDGAGQLDGAAEKEQFFGQGGLAGVGVADDAEGAPPQDLFLLSFWQLSILWDHRQWRKSQASGDWFR
ncbi:MAG TPA: hypothetical protein VK852_12840 [Desulfobacterales bacterium]|nr:hypothetical protein [Desulfobacterales bacterium]